MYNSIAIDIEFTYNGKVVKRTIDKMKFHYTDCSYTIYRIQGIKSNYDLLKAGKWWQVDVVDPLKPALLEAIGAAIDRAEAGKH